MRRHGALAQPKIVSALRHYNARTTIADLTAGVTVGLVTLPLPLAFAISSGLAPQTGLYTAVRAGSLISLLGGSRLQIGGPTGAFVVIVFGIVADHGVEGLFVCTVMAGVMLVVLGATGMGSAVRFIPRPVIVGFTNGIAVLIASTQLPDFFGLEIDRLPGDFIRGCRPSRPGSGRGRCPIRPSASAPSADRDCRSLVEAHSWRHHRTLRALAHPSVFACSKCS